MSDLTDSRTDAIRDVRLWAAEQECILTLDGEVGFGRPCVGIMHNQGYIDTPGSGYNEFPDPSRREWDDRLMPPEGVNAYHKHDCLAVLGTDEQAVDGLLAWVAKIRSHGGRVVVHERPVDRQAGIIGLLIHGTTRAVIEFPDDAPETTT